MLSKWEAALPKQRLIQRIPRDREERRRAGRALLVNERI